MTLIQFSKSKVKVKSGGGGEGGLNLCLDHISSPFGLVGLNFIIHRVMCVKDELYMFESI